MTLGGRSLIISQRSSIGSGNTESFDGAIVVDGQGKARHPDHDRPKYDMSPVTCRSPNSAQVLTGLDSPTLSLPP
jgi:hypothetical protein